MGVSLLLMSSWCIASLPAKHAEEHRKGEEKGFERSMSPLRLNGSRTKSKKNHDSLRRRVAFAGTTHEQTFGLWTCMGDYCSPFRLPGGPKVSTLRFMIKACPWAGPSIWLSHKFHLLFRKIFEPATKQSQLLPSPQTLLPTYMTWVLSALRNIKCAKSWPCSIAACLLLQSETMANTRISFSTLGVLFFLYDWRGRALLTQSRLAGILWLQH